MTVVHAAVAMGSVLVPHEPLKRALWASAALALASLAALALIDEHLKTPAAPLGIVSFEICAFDSSCDDILASWSASAKIHAAMSLGLDYLFMLAYPAAIGCGLLLLARQAPGSLRGAMGTMARAIWLAGLADAIENYHLFQMLSGSPLDSHPWLATLSATAKFACLVPALALLAFGAARSAMRTHVKPEEQP